MSRDVLQCFFHPVRDKEGNDQAPKM
uniref:Ubiquitin-conjugating enzyme family protein n=1 Tax=Rhizophora mucronata TaxID=61149 RepID=A0A2P2J0N8_RHIMU